MTATQKQKKKSLVQPKAIRGLTEVVIRFRSMVNTATRKTITLIEKHPFKSFLSVLAVLLALIALSTFMRTPKIEPKAVEAQPKKVAVYHIGVSPRVTVQGQVERSDVIQIVAQTPGIVQDIYASEGDTVGRGAWIIGLSSNYQGGNIASLQRQLAEKQYNNVKDSYPLQKDLLGKSRNLANKLDDNNAQLRAIANQSVNDNANLITLNQDIINGLDANINFLESTNVGGSNDALILTAKQYKAQAVAGLNQLNAAQRSVKYQSDDNNIPAELGHVQKDITLRQLEIQEKALDFSVEASRLQLAIAQASEAMMFPATPFAGVIERINVRIGQSVSPGTVIATVRGVTDPTQIVAYVPENIASKLSKTELTTMTVAGKTVSMKPEYISRVATSGYLFTVTYTVPVELELSLTDKSYVTLSIPVGYPDTGAVLPFVPLDSIYQSQDAAYVFLLRRGKAFSKKVTLGSVYGHYVEVEQGIGNGDVVILDRTVIANDPVKAQ